MSNFLIKLLFALPQKRVVPEIGAKELERNFSKLSFYMVCMLPLALCVLFLSIYNVATGVVGLFINLPNLCALLRSISQVS